jgi:hypothetical protein
MARSISAKDDFFQRDVGLSFDHDGSFDRSVFILNERIVGVKAFAQVPAKRLDGFVIPASKDEPAWRFRGED